MSKVDELREVLKAKKEAETKVEASAEGGSASGGKAEAGDGAEDIETCIRAAEQEAKEHYDKLLRVMAEFENFKKRVSREQDEKTKYANEKLILEILPVLDDFDRVLDHISEDGGQEVKAIADGAGLIRKTLFNAMVKFGLDEIDAQGRPFDPAVHEAVSTIQSDEHEDNTVVAVHRKGYKLYDRVIRAAQVIVSKKGNSNA